MDNEKLINVINSRIRHVTETLDAFDREGRNTNSLQAKIDTYEDVLMLLSE